MLQDEYCKKVHSYDVSVQTHAVQKIHVIKFPLPALPNCTHNISQI